jgi:hypothetical protein
MGAASEKREGDEERALREGDGDPDLRETAASGPGSGSRDGDLTVALEVDQETRRGRDCTRVLLPDFM